MTRRVRINGAWSTLEDGDLAAVLRARGIVPGTRGVAVAVNGAVVPRREWDRRELADGDEIEIVQAVQGG